MADEAVEQGGATRTGVVQASKVPAAAEQVWQRIVTPEGIIDELVPVQRLDHDATPGESALTPGGDEASVSQRDRG